jgi:hypothetical protein
MPVVTTPPAYVQQQEQERVTERPSASVVHSTPLGPNTTLGLHNLRQNPETGEVGVGGISLHANDLRRSLFPQAPALGSQGPSITPQKFGQLFATRATENLQLTNPSYFEKMLENAGIRDMDVVIRFDGDSPTGSVVTSGDIFSQRLDVVGSHTRYSISGEPFRDFFDYITNGTSEFSGVTLYTDGREFALAPSVRIHTMIPGITTTLTTRVGQTLSSTESLTPTIGDGLFREPVEYRDPLALGSGRMYINSYQFPNDPNSLATRFDFEREDHQGSLLIASGIGEGNQTYNLVALRGTHFFGRGLMTQSEGMYAQHLGGGHGLGGEFTLTRTTERSIFEFGIGGHQYWPGQGSGWDPNIPHILGTNPHGTSEGRVKLEFRW